MAFENNTSSYHKKILITKLYENCNSHSIYGTILFRQTITFLDNDN